MVDVHENGFTVHVAAGTASPAEVYTDTLHGLIDLLQDTDPAVANNRYQVLELLREMLPTAKQVKRMMPPNERKTLPLRKLCTP